MHSIHRPGLVDLLFDEFEAAHKRFLELPFHSLTAPELLAVLEDYAFLMGRLDALRYELTSPFVRSSGREIEGGMRRR